MNNYRCHRRTQENGVLISGMLTAAERRKRIRVRWDGSESEIEYAIATVLLTTGIPTDLRRQLDKKFLHSAVTLIDGLIGVCRKLPHDSGRLTGKQEVIPTIRPELPDSLLICFTVPGIGVPARPSNVDDKGCYVVVLHDGSRLLAAESLRVTEPTT
jgi:hypothetical protein